MLVYCNNKSLETFSIFVIISTSVTLCVSGISLIGKPISTGLRCGVTVSNKLINDIVVISILKVKNRLTEHNRQLTLLIKNLENVYKIKRLTKKDYESWCSIFTKTQMETKFFLFWKGSLE